jgi:maltose alpha-D-glucosyltransferase/alpha-amylase
MLPDDPLWYKDAVIYELHVRAFHDSAGGGVGTFPGLTRKLDYLQDLGVTAVWLLPFYPSPLRDDGYDITDYTAVHPSYGTLDDFKEFLNEAHKRNIRVITELVINHTSDEHPWFQRARRAPEGSPERGFYVWSDTPDKYANVPIMFPDFETSNWAWDPVAHQYYWHRFYSHQPDLNYDNPAVWDAILPVVDFWFGLGVDGMRLDAVPYLYEREGTSCEHLPETHTFLKALRKHVDERYPNRMFLAEANAWPEDAVAYFGAGDECHMAFHFPLMPRLFMALHQEDRFPILDVLAQTPAVPAACQWCLFLRNHDELTLAMVTDEERDYMFRAYTQDREAKIFLGIRRRLAPLLSNDRRQIELMNALLFSLPGTPVIYYGDEIGMGDNIYLGDRNGVRTPMQWSGDRNAGFSRANPQRLYLPVIIDPEYHYEAVNVEAQQNNPSSLLWWTKRLIAVLKRFKAFGRGALEFLKPANPKVLAFVREYREERILVVANLSRFVQSVELDLRPFAGVVPEELFGRSLFPPAGEAPYSLTLGPYGVYWFSLAPRSAAVATGAEAADLPLLHAPAHWTELTSGPALGALEAVLPRFIQGRRPAGSEAAATCRVLDTADAVLGGTEIRILTVRTEFPSRMAETALLTLAFVPDGEGTAPPVAACVARVEGPVAGVLCEALAVPAYCAGVLDAVAGGRAIPIREGTVVMVPLPGLQELLAPESGEGPPTLHRNERNNTSVTYGARVVLRRFGRVEEGLNPDLEVGRFLTKRAFPGVPPVVGYIEYRRRGTEPATVAVLHRFVANQGTAWQYALDQLSRYFERVAAAPKDNPPAPPKPLPLTAPGGAVAAGGFDELAGGFLLIARGLGRQTAELHAALVGAADAPAFTPAPFDRQYQRSAYQTMRNRTGHVCDRLRREGHRLPEPTRGVAAEVAGLHDAILDRFRGILDRSIDGRRIRCHGDLHLGQWLFTGRDFVVIDFEGDPARTVGERRIKRSPLRDVASMVRSFDYATSAALDWPGGGPGRPPGVIRPEDRPTLAPWAAAWHNQVARSYAAGYFEAMAGTDLLPRSPEARQTVLGLYLLERALSEVEYELSRRSDWVAIPLRAVLRLLGRAPGGAEEWF